MTRRFAFADRLLGFPNAWWKTHSSRHADAGAAFEAAVVWRTNLRRHGIEVEIQVGEMVETDRGREFRALPPAGESQAA